MRTARLKSGGHVVIYGEGESPVSGEINFSEKEYELALKLSKNTHDPEAQREFWKTVLEKKKADESYSLFADFPEMGSDESAVPTLHGSSSASAAAPQVKDTPRRDFKGADICHEIIETLRGRGVKTRKEREQEESA